MSNSDDQLDALYERTQTTGGIDDDSMSPADIDAAVLAAAREAASGETGAEITGQGWQQRYGWATAATLLLSSVLFFAVIDNPDPSNATQPVPAADSVADSVADPVIEGDESLQADAADAREFAPRSMSTDQEAPAANVPLQHEALQQKTETRELAAPPLHRSPVPPPAPQLETAQQVETAPQGVAADSAVISADRSSSQTGSAFAAAKSAGPACLDYAQTLIGKACKTMRDPEVIHFYAHPQSDCAGDVLQLKVDQLLTTQMSETDRLSEQGLPTRQRSSDMSRFVLPDQEIVCRSGRLVIQSLARGR